MRRGARGGVREGWGTPSPSLPLTSEVFPQLGAPWGAPRAAPQGGRRLSTAGGPWMGGMQFRIYAKRSKTRSRTLSKDSPQAEGVITPSRRDDYPQAEGNVIVIGVPIPLTTLYSWTLWLLCVPNPSGDTVFSVPQASQSPEVPGLLCTPSPSSNPAVLILLAARVAWSLWQLCPPGPAGCAVVLDPLAALYSQTPWQLCKPISSSTLYS